MESTLAEEAERALLEATQRLALTRRLAVAFGRDASDALARLLNP